MRTEPAGGSVASDGAKTDDHWEVVLGRYEADMRRRGMAAAYIAQQVARVRHFMALTRLDSFRAATPGHVRLWLSELAENGMPRPDRTGGERRPCQGKTLNGHKSGLSGFWKWLAEAEEIHGNPTRGVEPAQDTAEDQRALTPTEVCAIVLEADRDEQSLKPRKTRRDGSPVRRADAYRLMAITGLRWGTVCHLRWRHFDLGRDPAMLEVPAGIMKSRKPWSMALPEWYRDRLRPQAGDPSDLVWGRVRHDVLRADAVAAGVAEYDHRGRRVGFHGFRRMVATEMLEAGVSPATVQHVLGHSDLATTMRYDTRSRLRAGREVAEHAGRIFFSKGLDRGSSMPEDVPGVRHEITPAHNESPAPRRDAQSRGGARSFGADLAGPDPGGGESDALHRRGSRSQAAGSRFESCCAHSSASTTRILRAESRVIRARAAMYRARAELAEAEADLLEAQQGACDDQGSE